MRTTKHKHASKGNPAIIDTPQGKLIMPHTNKQGRDIGPLMLMNVNQFLSHLQREKEENKVAQ
jgi:hypothetical protein